MNRMENVLRLKARSSQRAAWGVCWLVCLGVACERASGPSSAEATPSDAPSVQRGSQDGAPPSGTPSPTTAVSGEPPRTEPPRTEPPSTEPSSTDPAQGIRGIPPTQPPAVPSPLAGTKPDLGALNRWATEAGVRNDLAAWVTHGLPLLPDVTTELSIRFNRVEAPDGATVTVMQDGYLDDSIRGERFVLQFSRKPCDDCEGGMSPWWLWSLEATQRCRQGRGHQEYSAEPCL